MADPVCIVPSGDRTGEGIIWSAEERAVYWTDINRFLIHRYDVDSRSTRSWFFNEPVTTLGLTDRPGTLIAALGSKVILWQPANDARADFSFPEKNIPGTRLNDGAPDPSGRFFVGSMFNNVAETGSGVEITDNNRGSLYRIDKAGRVDTLKTKIGISNTMVWDVPRKRFYTGDTLSNELWVFDYDPETGAISNERMFFAGFERGGPDGSSIDAEGHVWNARYGGASIVRIAPEGKVSRVLDMPVTNITNCTFGGPDLKTLYVTTAEGAGGPLERLSGGLFVWQSDVPGLPENRFLIDGK